MALLRTLLVVGRVSNLPTLWSNCLAGWWLGGAGNPEQLSLLVAGASLLYLSGTELDYKDELMQSGFVFQNPNVKKSCGCGASFTV